MVGYKELTKADRKYWIQEGIKNNKTTINPKDLDTIGYLEYIKKNYKHRDIIW